MPPPEYFCHSRFFALQQCNAYISFLSCFMIVNVIKKMTAFWDVVPRSLVEVDRHFRGVYCLHHQDDE
jgi:hypothetical protein